VLGEQEVQRIIQQVLGYSRADETEVVFFGTASQLTRFANNYIHQHVGETNTQVSVRVVLGKKIGVASTNDLSAEGLQRTVEHARTIAQFQRDNPDYQALPGPLPIRPADSFRHTTAAAAPEQRADGVAAICRRAVEHGLVASGSFSTAVNEIAVGNSHGILAYQPTTVANLTSVIMGEGGSGYADRSSMDIDDIDAEAVGQEAVDKALRSRNPGPIEPGAYDVLLEEYAVADMLDYISYIGLGALAVQEKRSFMRLGEPITGPNITIVDDAHDDRTMAMAFDFEGVPKQQVEIIKNGVANAVVYDSYTAGREPGRTSTGHALPAPNTYGPLPLNLRLEPGTQSKADLIKDIERGLWITRFHYVNIVHPVQTILTGMTRDGTFLIEHGEVKGPVRNLRFTQSVLEAFKQAELSNTLKLQNGFVGGTLVPAARIRGFNFSSVTEF
jgi:predicted Zn-dependent protease